MLGDGGGKRDDVVLGDLLDFLDACNVERAVLTNVSRGFGWHDASLRHRIRGRHFHQQPCFVPALVTPDAPHVGVRIAWNHEEITILNRVAAVAA